MGAHLFTGGTSGTTTTTTLASQGGLLINIDSATGDIAQTSSGWIEDEKYGSYNSEFATSTSAEFDTAVTRTGTKTLKLSTLDATGRARRLLIPAANYSTATTNLANSRNLIPIKPSTKYKISCFVKTNNVASNSAFVEFVPIQSTGALAAGGSTTNKLTGTLDWTLCTVGFTSAVNAVFLGLICSVDVAGNISDAWFDINSMTLEEVVEPVANSLTSSSPSLVSLQAVGSTDNIDQSFTTAPDGSSAVGNVAGVQYMESQGFTATKSKLTGVYIYKQTNLLTPTGNFKVDIRTDNAGVPSSTILASYTIPLATYNALAVGEFLVNLPCNLTAGSVYHIVCTDTATEGVGNAFRVGSKGAGGYTLGVMNYSADGGTTWLPNGTADMYFKTLYYKPTTNFKASQNNSTVSISADEDGFLDGSVINLTTGAFTVPDVILTRWNGATTNNSYQGLDVNKYNAFYTATNVNWTAGTTYNIISPTTATPANGYVTKFQGLGFNEITTSIYVANVGGTNVAGLAYSYDGVNYTEFATVTDDTEGGVLQSFTLNTAGNSEVYISLYRKSGSDLRIYEYKFSGTVDVSSLSTLRNYPTNKDIIKQYSTTLGSATTSATYRATKWGFPAIEYSATEYQYLDIDTTATGSTVAFSELGASYTTVADGASLAITSTSTPSLWVKTNITANRLYPSSNDYNASSSKDGSLKQSVVYQVANNPYPQNAQMNSNIKFKYG